MHHIAHTWAPAGARSFTADLLIAFEWDRYAPADRDGSLPQGGFRGVERVKCESITAWQESVVVTIEADALPAWLAAEVVTQFMVATSDEEMESICRVQIEAEDESQDEEADAT